MFWPFACSRERHRDPRVVGLGVEIRGEVALNNLRPYVRFYFECKKCGATGDRLREAGKMAHTLDDLTLPFVWEERESGDG